MSIQIGSVTINKNPVYGTTWWKERMNHYSFVTADGTKVTYDAGPGILRGVIMLKNVARAEGDALRTYITGTAIYMKNSFTITISALTHTDLGAGAGTNVTTAFWDGGATTENWFELVAPDQYHIRFPYWKNLG